MGRCPGTKAAPGWGGAKNGIIRSSRSVLTDSRALTGLEAEVQVPQGWLHPVSSQGRPVCLSEPPHEDTGHMGSGPPGWPHFVPSVQILTATCRGAGGWRVDLGGTAQPTAEGGTGADGRRFPAGQRCVGLGRAWAGRTKEPGSEKG